MKLHMTPAYDTIFFKEWAKMKTNFTSRESYFLSFRSTHRDADVSSVSVPSAIWRRAINLWSFNSKPLTGDKRDKDIKEWKNSAKQKQPQRFPFLGRVVFETGYKTFIKQFCHCKTTRQLLTQIRLVWREWQELSSTQLTKDKRSKDHGCDTNHLRAILKLFNSGLLKRWNEQMCKCNRW